eukprot:1195362-Prorocentrum_minimum.AAC.8
MQVGSTHAGGGTTGGRCTGARPTRSTSRAEGGDSSPGGTSGESSRRQPRVERSPLEVSESLWESLATCLTSSGQDSPGLAAGDQEMQGELREAGVSGAGCAGTSAEGPRGVSLIRSLDGPFYGVRVGLRPLQAACGRGVLSE